MEENLEDRTADQGIDFIELSPEEERQFEQKYPTLYKFVKANPNYAFWTE